MLRVISIKDILCPLLYSLSKQANSKKHINNVPKTETCQKGERASLKKQAKIENLLTSNKKSDIVLGLGFVERSEKVPLRDFDF